MRSTYSRKVLVSFGDNIWIRAAPSNSFASTCGALPWMEIRTFSWRIFSLKSEGSCNGMESLSMRSSSISAGTDANSSAIAGGTSAVSEDEHVLAGFWAWRQEIKWALVPDLSWPSFESAGGHAWFSCLKNSSRFPFLDWQEMYSLENNEQSFFKAVTVPFGMELGLHFWFEKRGSLFFRIGEFTDCERLSKRSSMKVLYCSSPSVWMV